MRTNVKSTLARRHRSGRAAPRVARTVLWVAIIMVATFAWAHPALAGRLVLGSELPSQLAEPDAKYVNGRSINMLNRLGALDDAMLAVARRSDALDGFEDWRMELATLALLEDEAHDALLFPDEREALPRLWQLLRYHPSASSPDAVQIPTAQDLQEQVALHTALAYPDLTVSIPIEQLERSTSDKRTARRIQFVANSDSNAETISLGDVRYATDHRRGFTGAEIAAFSRLREAIKVAIRKLPAPGEASLEVPMPGVSVIALPHDGEASFEVVREIAITDELRLTGTRRPSILDVSSFAVTRETRVQVTYPDTGEVVLVHLDDPQKDRLVSRTGREAFESGHFQVEVWRHGQVANRADLLIPEFERSDTVDLIDYVGLSLRAGETALVRSSLPAAQRRGRSLVGQYVPSDAERPAAETTVPISSLSRFSIPLVAGIYTISGLRHMDFRVYSHQLMSVREANGSERFFAPTGGSAQTGDFLAKPNERSGTIDITHQQRYRNRDYRLRESARVLDPPGTDSE